MILFDLANEAGFLDVVGLDVSDRACLLSEDLDGHWQLYCQHHNIPSVTVHSAYGELEDRCIVKCVANPGRLQSMRRSRLVEESTDQEHTLSADGFWVSESVSKQTAYAIARTIVALLDFERPQVEWVTSGPLN